MALYDKDGKPVNPVSYHPNYNLALAIVRAWNEPGYKDRLLTFPQQPFNRTTRPTDADYQRTSQALQEVDIALDKPVVLTFKQYDAVGYQKVEDEVVFVLPDPLKKQEFAMPTAEIAMIVTPLGM